MSKKAKWIIAVISAVVILIVGFAITKAVIANIEEKKAQEEYEKEQVRLQQWYDFDCDMAEIVSNYDFTGTLEENLEEWDAFGVEMEKYMDDQIEAGILDYYSEGLASYYILFSNGFELLLQAPFELEGIMGGGEASLSDLADVSSKTMVVSNTSTKETSTQTTTGRILTMEPVSNERISTHSLISSSEVASKSEHNYEIISIKKDGCDDIYKLMNVIKNWGQYDVVALEAHGENYTTKSGVLKHLIQITGGVDYLEFTQYMKETDYFSGNYIIGVNAFSSGNWRPATEEEILNRYNLDYKVDSLDKVRYDRKLNNKSVLPEWRYDLLKMEEDISGEISFYVPQNVIVKVNDEFFTKVFSKHPLNNRPIIYLSNCFAGQDDAVANALINSGARAVMCYYNATDASYHADMYREIMKCLTSHNEDTGMYYTLEEAVASAKAKYGEVCNRNTGPIAYALKDFYPDGYDFENEKCYLRLFTSEDNIRLPIYSDVIAQEPEDDEYYSSGLDVPQDMPEKPQEDEEINVVPVYIENAEDAKLWESISTKYPTPETLEAGDEYVILGWCYSLGVGVEQDKQRAIECYVKAVDMGSYKGAQELVWCYLNGDGALEDWKLAVNWYDKYETMWYDRQTALMEEHQVGDGAAVRQYMDTLRAVQLEWLETVAEDTQSIEVMMRIYELWDCYDICQVPEETAMAWLEKAAEKEYPKAVALLATYYSSSYSYYERDYEKSIDLMKKAVGLGETSYIPEMIWAMMEVRDNEFLNMCLNLANQNDPNAVCFMGAYYQGLGDDSETPYDEKKGYYDAAHDYDIKGKELGDIRCAWNVALHHWNTTVDFADSIPYFEVACEMDRRWYSSLAVMGYGRTYDGFTEEMYYNYLKLAAEAGDQYAMIKICDTLEGDEYWTYYKYVSQVERTYKGYEKTDNKEYGRQR